MMNLREPLGSVGKFTAESNAYRSSVHKGHKHSEEAKAKMSAYWTGRARPDLKGKSGVRFWSKEDKLNRSINSPNKIQVIQLDKNNVVIRVWPSISDAAKFIGVTRSSISNVCANRKKSVGGYKWKYE